MVTPAESLALLILFYGVHGAAFLLGLRAGARSSSGGWRGLPQAVPGFLIVLVFVWLLFQIGASAWWSVFSRFVDVYFAPGLVSLPALYLSGRWLTAGSEART